MVVSQTDPPQANLFFDSLVERYIYHSRFLRRPWLADEVDKALRAPDCRFVLLTAEPGAGKSTFIAQLAYDHRQQQGRPQPLYFLRRDQRALFEGVGPRSFLLQLGHQLAALYPNLFNRKRLEFIVEQRVEMNRGEVIGPTIDQISTSPFYNTVIKFAQDVTWNEGKVAGGHVREVVAHERFLSVDDLQYMALIDPAWGLQEEHPNKQLVILVDALDEVRYHKGQETLVDWLAKVPNLPPNVRFVLTSRPEEGKVGLFREAQKRFLREIKIEKDDARVQKDLRLYMAKMVKEDAVAAALSKAARREGTMNVTDFTKGAVKKADGNIGYLNALARGVDQTIETEDGETLGALLSLDVVPDDLEGLYSFFLGQVKGSVGEEKWGSIYMKVLGVLSVAREALTLEQIRALGDIGADWSDLTGAALWLRQFLNQERNRYQFYHATVPEFLTAEKTKASEELSTANLYIDAVRWHKRLADYYWTTRETRWEGCDAYGLRNLAEHLYESDDTERLQALISKTWLKARSGSADVTYFDFNDDVNLAWRATTQALQTDVSTAVRLWTARHLVYESMNRYDDEELQTLVWLDQDREAEVRAQLRKHPYGRCKGLVSISYAIREQQVNLRGAGQEEPQDTHVADLLDKAFEAARDVADIYDREKALLMVAKALARAGYPDKARGAARAIEDSEKRDEAWRKVKNLIEGTKTEFRSDDSETTIRGGNDTDKLDEALQRGAKKLAWIGCPIEAKLVAHFVEGSSRRAETLLEVAKALAWVEFPKDALSVAQAIQNDERRARVLRSVAETLVWAGHPGEACNAARAIEDSEKRDAALCKVRDEIAKLEDAGGPTTEKQELVQSNSASSKRSIAILLMVAKVLARRASSDDVHSVAQAIENAVQAVESEYIRMSALLKLARILAEVGSYEAAERLARSIEGVGWRGEALFEVAKVLVRAGCPDQARDVARSIEDTDKRDEVLLEVTKGLGRAGHSNQALCTARSIENSGKRAEALRNVAKTLARAGADEAEAAFSESRKASRFSKDADENAEALSEVAQALAWTGYQEEAQEVASTIESEYVRSTTQQGVQRILSWPRSYEESWEMIHEPNARIERDYGLWRASKVLAGGGRDKEALDAVRAIEWSYAASKALLDVERVWELSDGGLKQKNTRAKVSRAEKLVRANYSGEEGNKRRLEVVKALAELGDYEEALEEAMSIEDRTHRSKTLSEVATTIQEVATALAVAGHYAEAKKAAHSININFEQTKALHAIAKRLAQEQQFMEALATYSPPRIDSCIKTLAQWWYAFEQAETGSFIAVLHESTAVAGWVRSDWQKIHELLPFPQPTPYYVVVGGQQTGPHDMQSLRQLVQKGKLTRDSLVWTEGMDEWKEAGEVRGLQSLFADGPPPLPSNQ